MPWIQAPSLNTDAIKIQPMGDIVHFSTNGYAEVDADTADLLSTAQQVAGYSVLDAPPDDPGIWPDSDIDTQVIEITLSDHDTYGDATVHGSLTVGGETIDNFSQIPTGTGEDWTVTATQTSDYTAENGEIVPVDASGGAVDVTLPSPASDLAVMVKKVDQSGNAVTVVTPGSALIDDADSLAITGAKIARTLFSNGTNWIVV